MITCTSDRSGIASSRVCLIDHTPPRIDEAQGDEHEELVLQRPGDDLARASSLPQCFRFVGDHLLDRRAQVGFRIDEELRRGDDPLAVGQALSAPARRRRPRRRASPRAARSGRRPAPRSRRCARRCAAPPGRGRSTASCATTGCEASPWRTCRRAGGRRDWATRCVTWTVRVFSETCGRDVADPAGERLAGEVGQGDRSLAVLVRPRAAAPRTPRPSARAPTGRRCGAAPCRA